MTMKKTQLTDALRNIKKQKVSYISIVLITLMALTCFMGISFSAKTLEKSSSEYYDRHNFRDLEVSSALLFTESDLQKIGGTEGVKDVEGQNRTNARITGGSGRATISVLSLTERINVPEINEGRAPEKIDECMIETGIADELGIGIGDLVSLSEDGFSAKLLGRDTFTVVGIADHPDHLVTPNSFTNYVIVTNEAFDAETLQGRTVLAEIVIDKPDGINRQTDKYFKLVSTVSQKLEELSVECAEGSLKDIWDRFNSYKIKLRDDVLKPLLTLAVREATGVDEEEAKQKVDSFGWKETYDLDLKAPDLDLRLFDLAAGLTVRLPDAEELGEFVAGLPGTINSFLESKGINSNLINVPEDIAAEIGKLAEGSELSNQYNKILQAAQMWNTGHQRYLTSLEKLEGGGNSDDMGVWILMDAKMNPGFAHLRMSAQGLTSISLRFTILFIIIGAIVIYATVGKLIEEQRKLVGTTKAFGFYKKEIFSKYLLFGGSATVLGCVLGALAGIFLLQMFVVYAYGRNYLSGVPGPSVILWQLILIPIVQLLISFVAVFLACSKLLKSPAVRLMADETPQAVKKGKGKKSHLSLYQRLIFRNMRSDAPRVIVTVVSIAGCCVLIMVGLSIYAAVKTTVDTQFSKINRFDSVISLDKSEKSASDNISAVLDNDGIEYIPAYLESGAIRLNGNTEPADFTVADLDKIDGYIRLANKKSKKTLTPSDDGIMLPSTYAEAYSLKEGDSVVLVDSLGGTHRAEIAGIFEFYMGKNIIMSPGAYEKVFSEKYSPNSLLLKHPGTDREALKEELKSVPGFDSITRSDPLKAIYDGYSDLLGYMMAIMATAAGLMSAVIITNLINIYILQKKRELTVMRINGFTTKEVKSYVSREAIFTTAVGSVIGIVVAILLARAIIPALGKSYSQFILTPNIWAILISVAITSLFTLIIYKIALRKVKNLKLTDMA